MAAARILRFDLVRSTADDLVPAILRHLRGGYSTISSNPEDEKETGRWLTLPPFTPTINGDSLGKKLAAGGSSSSKDEVTTSMTALKWVFKCCPDIPKSLVQKIFRLRQVRRESSMLSCDSDVKNRLRRVAAKDPMNTGDRVYLPAIKQRLSCENSNSKTTHHINDKEASFLHSLVLHKDPAILVINKPSGMPVQGGVGIKQSLDELATTYLKFDYPEAPKLVHRLDRDCSGILVLARTQMSASVLHSIFREETLEASKDPEKNKILQKRYLALVIGVPRRSEGLISAPLGQVNLSDGKSVKITVIDSSKSLSSQHALTKYRVIESSPHGYSWIELSPLTGRKHQLRVHCAEVLGTPIVGDYKYGRKAHSKMKPLGWLGDDDSNDEKYNKSGGRENSVSFDDLGRGSISDEEPSLHLHCKEIILPSVFEALQQVQANTECDVSKIKSLKLIAPLPPHMQRSWTILKSS
ncbi:RNA pseudouridine synthase 4, mitochondrial [Impatiens glandulifera]|uniref:RNA pseudouridine synthase 4, mitochondrial n=1 Tax=Impatiens glandulifera TaxID=253017 RepID=UPI001FB0D648|nr:RNA pseudouridine synthase 4, mitochondrial [Impatiens glandulifera]